MTQTFSNWTEYDNWLIQNYDKYAITSLNENEGKITADFIDKAEWEAAQKKEEEKDVNVKSGN